ncbi:MAG TPA: hypothetical protein ENJ00_11025 [Phycisphaerales bacterium]|nr:hypothetical protein [Phycisphaerales bacterium]
MVDPRYQFVWDDREGIWESSDGGLTFGRISSRADWDSAWSQAFWAITESFSGPVQTIGEDLSDADALYWCNGQFAYASLDRGQSLQSIFADERSPGFWASRGLDNIVTMKIIASEADPDVLYLGSFDIGLWRSLDGGLSWSSCNQAAYTGSWDGNGGNTLTIAADPDDASKVWAPQAEAWAGPAQLLKSTDSGATWNAVGSGLPADALLGLSLDRTSPVGGRTLFISAGGDIYRSTDDGASFALALADGGLTVTAVDHFNGQIVYAGGRSGLWRSTAGGAPGTWQEVGPASFRGPAGFDVWDDGFIGVFDIVPDPFIPGRVYASVTGEGQFVSDDAGVSWSQILGDPFARSVAVSFDDPDVLYAVSSSALLAGGYDPTSLGLQRSDDGGATWQSLNAGLPYPFAVSIALDPRDPCAVMIASPGVGVRRGTAACPCPADVNRDGQLNAADFTAWIAASNTLNPACDQNDDGSCTPGDFTAWIANFNAGCP